MKVKWGRIGLIILILILMWGSYTLGAINTREDSYVEGYTDGMNKTAQMCLDTLDSIGNNINWSLDIPKINSSNN